MVLTSSNLDDSLDLGNRALLDSLSGVLTDHLDPAGPTTGLLVFLLG